MVFTSTGMPAGLEVGKLNVSRLQAHVEQRTTRSDKGIDNEALYFSDLGPTVYRVCRLHPSTGVLHR